MKVLWGILLLAIVAQGCSRKDPEEVSEEAKNLELTVEAPPQSQGESPKANF